MPARASAGAARVGREIGAEAVAAHGAPVDADAARRLALGTLAAHGYEPCTTDGVTHLRNCPFHALAADQPDLVCRMNHVLIGGLAEALPHCPRPRLEPGENRCCVLIPGVAADGADPA